MHRDPLTLAARLQLPGFSMLLVVALGTLLWSTVTTPERAGSPSPFGASHEEVARLERTIDPATLEWIPARAERGPARFVIDGALAEALWGNLLPARPLDDPDPDAYHRVRRKLDARMPFEEHPQGEWRLRTNSLGMRRDGEPAVARPDLRLLVTGDSHTEGVCDNRESFSHLLELALAQRLKGRDVEVLNAASSHYSFYNYLGTLERFAPLAPHLAVVVVYGGNDFREVLALHDLFNGQDAARFTVVELEAFRRAAEINRPVLGQSWTANKLFRTRPERAEVALRASLEIAREKQALAAEAGFELLIVYLPPITDLPASRQREDLRRVAELLGLSEQDLDLTDRLADRYLTALADLGIEALDLRPVLAPHAERAFWRTDLNLALYGHRLVAEALLPRVLELVGEVQ